MRPEEVQATVMAMRDDAYRVMTGQPAPPMPDLTPPTPAGVTLGARVHFDYSDILRRASVELPHKHGHLSGRYGKEWRKAQWGKRGDVRHGIIVGVRTLVNGESQWSYGDEPIVFHPVTYFTAYLVAFDLRRKAVYLLPDDVEVQW
jgi:hypothetical protein